MPLPLRCFRYRYGGRRGRCFYAFCFCRFCGRERKCFGEFFLYHIIVIGSRLFVNEVFDHRYRYHTADAHQRWRFFNACARRWRRRQRRCRSNRRINFFFRRLLRKRLRYGSRVRNCRRAGRVFYLAQRSSRFGRLSTEGLSLPSGFVSSGSIASRYVSERTAIFCGAEADVSPRET